MPTLLTTPLIFLSLLLSLSLSLPSINKSIFNGEDLKAGLKQAQDIQGKAILLCEKEICPFSKKATKIMKAALQKYSKYPTVLLRIEESKWNFCQEFLDVEEFPQVFVLNSQGLAQIFDFPISSKRVKAALDQFAPSKSGDETGHQRYDYNIFQGKSRTEKSLLRVKKMITRIVRLLRSDNFLFGVLLLIMNSLFIKFAWSVSGIAVSSLYAMLFEISFEDSQRFTSSKGKSQ